MIKNNERQFMVNQNFWQTAIQANKSTKKRSTQAEEGSNPNIEKNEKARQGKAEKKTLI